MRKHRMISLGLAVLLAFQTPVLQCLAASEETSGAETEEDEEVIWEVVEISTVEEFEAFAEQCSLDSWSENKWVELKQNIDLSSSDVQVIPVFAGHFDGGGHTISGFHDVGDGYVGGLFRYIAQDGIVMNLKLRGSVEGTGDKECIGSICGVNRGTIRNCSFNGTISGRDTVGGIAGTNESTGFITGCTITGHVSGYYMTGGITGMNHGVMTYCTNEAGINDDSQWVVEDDEMGSGFLLGLGSADQDVEFYSGVDTGGIAGYSDGTISRCTNNGRVGYEHTGYNIGGIAGRQAGVVSLCTNNGQVYGRKDVGGIVGQMEPYIEVDEAESLRNSVNRLHSLIDKALNHLQAGKDVLKEDMDQLTAYGDGALESGHALADQLTDFVDANVSQLGELASRLEYVVDQLPAVMEDISGAMDAFGQFGASMRQLTEDLENEDMPGVSDGDAGNGGEASDTQEALDEAVDRLQSASEQVNRSADKINDILTDSDGSVKQWTDLTEDQKDELVREVMNLAEALGDMSSAASTVLSELSRMTGMLMSEEVKQDLRNATDQLQLMSTCLRNAANGTRSIVNYLSAQPDVHFTALGAGFDKKRENLNSQLQGIADSLKSLTEDASEYSDLVNADLKAVNDQLNIVFNLLADHLSGYDGLSVEELYEEVEEDETEAITSGRTDACTNRGAVRGDINIGGIVGSMTIDEEDPEDNAAGHIDYEVGRRFIMKCIIDSCVNEGNVTAKKDGAGGVVGYMGHGIVIDSENYGSVESTEGGYVGGICGESLTVIRRCYALCDVSGSRNVGGIAGYAVVLKDCYAIVNVEAASGRMGAVAGQVADYEDSDPEEEPQVCRNYYVDDVLCGIDNISYAGIAEPISYQELLTVEGMPSAFWHLKVIYRVEDEYLGSEEVAFGESLAGLHYPEIPARDGCYGVWPDHSEEVMSGNLVIDGEYHSNVLVVESNEKDRETSEGAYQRPYALVEQTFTEDTVLTVSDSSVAPPEEAAGREYVMYRVRLENGGITDADTFAVRLLNPYDNAEVWGLKADVWTMLDSKPRGQYLQVDMTGAEETFCIVCQKDYTIAITVGVAGAAAAILFITMLVKRIKKRGKVHRKGDAVE